MVAKTPNAPARSIKSTLPKIRPPRPLDSFLLINRTMRPTKKTMTPIAMSKAPKGAGKVMTPIINVIKPVIWMELGSAESDVTSALDWAEGMSSPPGLRAPFWGVLVAVSDNKVSTIHGRNSTGVEGRDDDSDSALFDASSISLLNAYNGNVDEAGK